LRYRVCRRDAGRDLRRARKGQLTRIGIFLLTAFLLTSVSLPLNAAVHKKRNGRPAAFGKSLRLWQVDDNDARKGNSPDVRIVTSPVGGVRYVLGLTATPTANGVDPSQSPGSDQTDAWLPSALNRGGHHGTPQTSWYHMWVYFPTDYRPTSGDWNFFQVWHLDDQTGRDSGGVARSPGFTVDTSKGGPKIKLRWASGSNRAPRLYDWFDRTRLKRGHWYDELMRVTWSCNASQGRVQWWQDGRLFKDRTMQTLYSRSDGSCGYVGFGLYNYRVHATWKSTIYFGAVKIGPTRASVR
jgi:Polysaccharide lyase